MKSSFFITQEKQSEIFSTQCTFSEYILSENYSVKNKETTLGIRTAQDIWSVLWEKMPVANNKKPGPLGS